MRSSPGASGRSATGVRCSEDVDTVGFGVELANKGNKDLLYDPESFGVRVGDEVYRESVSDAGGLIPAGKVQTVFFVVTGTASGSRNDLAVTNKFAVVMREVTGEMDPHRKVTAEWHEPPDTIPTAQAGWRERPMKARELLNSPEAWCQESPAEDPRGNKLQAF